MRTESDGRGGAPWGLASAREQSSLMQHADSATVYGIYEPSPESDDETSDDGSSVISKPLDEEARLSASSMRHRDGELGPTPEPQPLGQSDMLRIVLPMLLSVFIANADGSIVMATHPIIASEFMELESSSWLFTGFMLASTATQTTLGQVSEIYGRKPIILFSYAIFGLGCLIVGLAKSMILAILGRILSGAVSAGTNVLVSLVITDLLPVREVAPWRSYVNVVAVSGRCIGGPLGGWLADVIGWRWSFMGQAPIFFLSILFCWRALPNTRPAQSRCNAKDSEDPDSTASKLGRVDFLGSALLATFLILILLPLELGGTKIPWSDPRVPLFFGGGAIFLVLFVAAEKWFAKEPLLPLDLFESRPTVASFFIMLLQCAAQLGLMYCVPLYFQVTKQVSNTVAGAHLLPAVIGNAIGGILSGFFIKKTGKYQWLIFLATLTSASCYALLLLRWHGNTNWLESLYIFPGGFGTGIAMSAVFISVQASVDRARLAPAVSALYLSQGLGAVVGLAAMSASVQSGLRRSLESRLLDLHLDESLRKEIISKAVSSVNYIYQAKGDVAAAVVDSYVDGLWYSHGVSFLFSMIAFLFTFMIKEYKL